MPLFDHVLTNSEAAGMLAAALTLAIFVGWPAAQEGYAWIVKRRLRRRIAQEHGQWIARRQARMQDILR